MLSRRDPDPAPVVPRKLPGRLAQVRIDLDLSALGRIATYSLVFEHHPEGIVRLIVGEIAKRAGTSDLNALSRLSRGIVGGEGSPETDPEPGARAIEAQGPDGIRELNFLENLAGWIDVVKAPSRPKPERTIEWIQRDVGALRSARLGGTFEGDRAGEQPAAREIIGGKPPLAIRPEDRRLLVDNECVDPAGVRDLEEHPPIRERDLEPARPIRRSKGRRRNRGAASGRRCMSRQAARLELGRAVSSGATTASNASCRSLDGVKWSAR